MKGCCDTRSYEGCVPRNFLTKDERIEMLKDYKETLDKESKGTQEKIEKLKGE